MATYLGSVLTVHVLCVSPVTGAVLQRNLASSFMALHDVNQHQEKANSSAPNVNSNGHPHDELNAILPAVKSNGHQYDNPNSIPLISDSRLRDNPGFRSLTVKRNNYSSWGPRRGHGDYTCGDGFCRCNGTQADCSWLKGRLNYVPKLPDIIRTLYFLGNGLTSITSDNFFQNVTGVTFLSLATNRLKFIIPAALLSLQHLNTLILDNNRNISIQVLMTVFSIPNLRILYLTDTDTGSLKEGIVHRNPPLQLERLNLDLNRISQANLTVLAPLVHLKILDLSLNSIGYGLTSDYLPDLDTLKLISTSLYTFPETCRNGTSLFPRLTDLELAHNHLVAMPGEICLPRLKYLSLTDNSFLVLKADWFSGRSFPVLYSLDVQSNTHLKSIQKYAFRNPSLESLWMAYIRLELALETVMDADSFAGCHNLHHLELNYNRWDGMTDARFHRLFGNLTRLRWFELENTGVNQITANTFSCLTALEKLNLQHNKLNVLPDGAFDKLTNLTSLYVNSNKIAVVGPASFGEATRSRLRDLDISNNPFSCSCDVLWFRQWLMDSPALFHYSWGAYTCANLPDTPIQDFHMAEQACLLSQASSIFIIIIVVLLVSVMTLASSLYRYRWHLRLVLYEAFRGRGERWRHLQEDHFLYDVFVSFDGENLDWVLQRLMPELEGRWGLRLCIHQRDFIPGQNIVDNIVDSVQASKKVLMLFSASFAASPWCQFELNLCLRHVMDYDDVLLVALLHEIPARDLTPAMMAVMNTTTYIEWDYTPDAVTSFWRKMKVALHEIMPRQ